MKIYKIVAFLVCYIGFLPIGHAQPQFPVEYNRDLLSQPAGAYLQTAHAIEQLAKSECAYRLEEEIDDRLEEFPTSAQAGREIRLHLDRSGQSEFDKFISIDRKNLGKESASLIQGFIARLRDDGVSFPDICEILVVRNIRLLEESRSKWMDAVWQYGRGDFYCTIRGAYEIQETGVLINSENNWHEERVGSGFRVDRETGYISGAINNFSYVTDPPVVSDYREAMDKHGYLSTVMPKRTSNLAQNQFRIELLSSEYSSAETFLFRYTSSWEIYTGTCILIAPTECPSEESGKLKLVFNGPPMRCD